MSLLRSIVIALLFVVGFEVVARNRGFLDPSTRPDPYLGFPGTNPLYQPTVGSDGAEIYEVAKNKQGMYRTQKFGRKKADNEFRVFCIGGSGVRSDAFTEDGTFPFMLWQYLRTAMPSRKITVLNCGGGGMGSIQNLEVLREVLDYGPDLIVLMPEGGEKNMVPPQPQGILAKEDDASPLRVLARRTLARLRLYQGLRDLYQRCLAHGKEGQAQSSAFSAFVAAIVLSPFQPDLFTRYLEFKVDRAPVLMDSPIPKTEIDVAQARFQKNLATMGNLAKERGVPFVVVMPLRNLRASFYLKFHVTPAEIQGGQVDEWKRRYDNALEAKKQGRFAEAIQGFQRVRELYVHDDDDILAYYIGECHERLGDKAAALAEYSKPYLQHPMRAEIKAVTDKEGFPLVDPFEGVVAIAEDGVPGYTEFTDSVHPMPKTNRVIARGVYETIQSRFFSKDLPPLTDPRLDRTDQLVLGASAKFEAPLANKMVRAINAGKYDDALKCAKAVSGDDLKDDVIAQLYYGWALTKLGKMDDVRSYFLKLKNKYAGQPGIRGQAKLESDADIIRFAFACDVFHWF